MVDYLNNVAALKAVDPSSLANNQHVVVGGFDVAGDGCGGEFYWSPGSLAVTLDGFAMNSSVNGNWRRHHEGPIHTSWAGIKPTSTPTSFDSEGRGSNNLQRWNNLNFFCNRPGWEILGANKSGV